VNRGPWNPQPAAPSGWNYATTGAAPVATTLTPGTVTRYRPAYQFPDNARALQGSALVPPGPSVSPPPVSESAWGGAGAPVPNTLAPPPTQWVPAAPQAVGQPEAPVPPQAPPGDWAAAAVIGGATAAAMQPSPAPVTAMAPPPSGPAPQMQPLQPSPPPTVPVARHTWRVVGVYDGDTVTCLDEAGQQQKVRLAGIDAPESSQDYGRASREALAGMVFGRTVEVVDSGRDASGAWLGRLFVDGQDVNRQMVATGNAWADPAAVDPALAAAQTGWTYVLANNTDANFQGPEELSFYVEREYTFPSNRLERYTVRPDGFVSVRAGYPGGELVTKPIVFTGKTLVLNYSTSAMGSIRIEILDEAGHPLPGFLLEDSPVLYGDKIAQVVPWKHPQGRTDRSPFSRLAGKPVRFRFVMRDADLFSIQFK
jgi:endonuclease YncB( thermonuclease family)